jgi:hypothetical protein
MIFMDVERGDTILVNAGKCLYTGIVALSYLLLFGEDYYYLFYFYKQILKNLLKCTDSDKSD